jgi:hypothetical protein
VTLPAIGSLRMRSALIAAGIALLGFALPSPLTAAATAGQAAHSRLRSGTGQGRDRARGGPTASASIIGGSPTSIEEAPWLAYVEAKDWGTGFACTGTVVAPTVILTAGHCVESPESETLTPPAEYLVATGVGTRTAVTPTDLTTVSRVLVYPGFNSHTLRGDAGLLILSAPTEAPPIQLASGSDLGLLQAGSRAEISGWGLTGTDPETVPDTLQSASTEIQSAAYCRQHAAPFGRFYSSASQLCTVNQAGHAVSGCFGDSGGPAVVRSPAGEPVEVGITSTGGPGCSPSLPDIYTRVDRVSSWVADWIAAVESGARAPVVKTPHPRPPRMTLSQARDLSWSSLEQDFNFRHRAIAARRLGCRRIARAEFRCRIAWRQSGDRYFGSITVLYALDRAADIIVWNDRYTIHRVDGDCWRRSAHRQRCAIHTRRH